MATASKSGFNPERFRKLVAHFRNSNANERDNAFHLAIAELGKASADVFRDMPDVVAELIGGAGSKETDELRRELERQLAQSRSEAANSRAEANENIAEAARRKAEAAQQQEIIDRLLKRIADLEAGATRRPPVEERKPEPPPVSPPPSSPPWYEDIQPEPEPEPAGETGEGEPAWIEIPAWKALFWIALAVVAGSYALLAAMVERPPVGADLKRAFDVWWAWLLIPALLLAAGRALYKFAGFVEDKIIIGHFPRLCLGIRARLISPRFMAVCVLWLTLLWAGFVVGWFMKENRLPVVPLVVGVVAVLTIWGLVAAREEYENFGAAGVICKPCALMVWMAATGCVVDAEVWMMRHLSITGNIAVIGTLTVTMIVSVAAFIACEDRLTAWALDDKRRFAGIVTVAVLLLLGVGIFAGRWNATHPATCQCPTPQAVAPSAPEKPTVRHAKPKQPARVSPEASQ